MPIYAEKNIRYVHFAEICEKCGNIRSMRQSHKTDMPSYMSRKCTSGFMDDVIFGPYEGMSIDTVAASDVTASSCAVYSAADASHWLCCIR